MKPKMNMLCLKLRGRGRSWGPSSESRQHGVDKRRRSHTISKMSPPLPVTEDTPPDMLSGSMDLRVILPSGLNVKMSVDRSTPMMDLLVQVTTTNKISPGGHVIQALGERGMLPYKPSTPIGALDTWTIHIVPKSQMANSGIKKAPLKPVNQPFEQTFRLQVHLPRNQLYVSRVSPKARLSDILLQVCSEKNLDPSRYSLRHPTNLEQVLNLKCTLADYKLQEVTLVYNTSLPVEVSTVDIMALQRDTSNPGYNNYINRNNRSCEGSVSSGSLGGRSLSPVPSDESSASPPPPPPSRPIRKRRPAPKPPTINNTNQTNGIKSQKESETNKSTTVICHSRNSSDSSGYHEASVLSESPQSNSLPDSLPRRSKLPSITSESEITETNLEVNSNNLSRSLSSLTAVENTTTVGMRQYQHSISTLSLSAAGGRKKKAAPPPPPTTTKMSSLSEEQQKTPSVSSTTSSTTTLDGNEASVLRKAATLPPLGRVPSITTVDSPESIPSFQVEASSLEPPESPFQESSPEPTNNENSELRLADEEIDRIFHNATRDHTSLESGVGDEPPLSLSSLPSPPASLTHKDINTSHNTDPLDWEYKLPAPPTFRDESNSPPVTEYGTLTISNLTEIFGQPSLAQTVTTENKTDLKKIVEEGRSIVKGESIVGNSNNIRETKRIIAAEKAHSQTAVQSKITDETVVEKGAVINELSTVITERLNRPESITEPVKKSSPELIAPSTLDNFTITTYKDTKPIEVFEDESIKSSAGEKRDTSKDDALFRAPKARIAEPNLTRTNSFTTDDKSYHPTVKRSVSYVSLLAANMPRTSQPYRAHLAKSNLALTENGSDTLLRREEVWPRLRKTSSELNISRESNNRKNIDEQLTTWQKSETESSDLQSLQVLRSILPQLSQSQSATDVVKTNTTLDEPNRVTSISKMKIEDTLVKNQGEIEPKFELPHSKENPQSHEKTKHSFSIDDVNLKEETQHYKYSGPPTINLSTWNERPKRQISIKNDRDYVIGIGKKQTNTEENQTQKVEIVKETPKPAEQSNITMRLVSRTNSRTERPKSAMDLGRVPIVRAVELKKPYVGSNIGLGYIQKGNTLPNQTAAEEPASSTEESFAGVNSLAQRFGQSKPRPVSSYLFGTESQIKSDDTKGNVQNQTGVSKVVLNAGKKFTSIVGINGPESKTEVKMTSDKLSEVKVTSRIHIGGIEERKIKLNPTLPNKIDYTSSSDIKALSKIRSGGIIDPSSPNEALTRPNFPEPNSNKSSVDSASPTTPVSPNVVNPRSWKSSTSSWSSSSSSNPLSPRLVSPSLKNTVTTPTSPKRDVFFGSNTIDRSTNIRPSNFPLPVVKGFRTTSESESSGGIPPPPPVMPLLKPVGIKKGFNTLPLPGKDPRDQLLESIRSFGKDGLKKVSKKKTQNQLQI